MFDNLSDSLVQFRKSKYYIWIRAVLRGICQYVFYALIFILAANNIVESRGFLKSNHSYPQLWEAGYLILFSCLILNSSIYIFAIFDTVMRKRFFQSRKEKSEIDPEEKTEPNLYMIEFGTLVVCCFLFPVWYAYDQTIAILPFSFDLPEIVDRLILTAFFALIAFFSVLRIGKHAQAYWLKRQQDAFKKRGYVAGEETNRSAYKKRKLILWMIGYAIGYGVVSALFPAFVPTALSLISGIALILREWMILVAIALILALIFGRTLWKRAKFLFRLKRLCRRHGFRIVEKNYPLLSIFHTGKSYHIAVEAHGKLFYCRMIASMRKKNMRLIFSRNGSFKRIFGLRLPTPAIMVQSRFAMGVTYIDSAPVEEREILRFQREGNYAFEGKKEGHKILLLNPVPSRAILGEGNRHNADNGDMIGEYSVYAGSAFLNALKNDAFYFIKETK